MKEVSEAGEGFSGDLMDLIVCIIQAPHFYVVRERVEVGEMVPV